ncbi:MAG: methyl-accepting chemotaxis protein [Candidatus Omnitrophica bacterium]|nr:methyl-accepting chemotaxis protein [Candidatus Omnitrophota bacterium]
MSTQEGRFVRRNYFVRKGFQLRFSLLVFITTLVIAVIAVWTTYTTTWEEISSQVKNQQFYNKINNVYTNVPDNNNAAMINSIIIVEFADIFDRVSGVLLLRIMIGAFVLFILSIFASHKIAGPLSRMENAARSLELGDLSVGIGNLRPGDELDDLAKALEGAIVKLRGLMVRYREMANRLTELANEITLYQAGGKSASEESSKLIKELEVVSNQLVTEMSYFNTKKLEIEDKQSAINTGKIAHY